MGLVELRNKFAKFLFLINQKLVVVFKAQKASQSHVEPYADLVVGTNPLLIIRTPQSSLRFERGRNNGV